jgi:hypothetical protein
LRRPIISKNKLVASEEEEEEETALLNRKLMNY